jgi:membrane-associated protease RseP (regulator of RpoE activity)
MAVPNDIFEPQPLKPSAGTWMRHLLLLAVTFCTMTIAGTMFPFGPYDGFPAIADPQTSSEIVNLIFSLPALYLLLVVGAVTNVLADPASLAYGLQFSLSLLFILICHEMGHYVACRIYKVRATLPFFIPTPPMIGPAGTFGAFIKILSPMPSRRAVFDIGVAGPIAGFVALLPIAALGLATMEMASPEQLVTSEGMLVFSDPLLMHVLGMVFGIDPSLGIGNAYYFAAWVGLLVTALNLIPSGQLDGGHAIYAIFGENVHYWMGRVAFVLMAALSVAGFYLFNSPSGFLITLILAVMMRVRHPRPWDMTPLDGKRKLIAVVTLAIFALSFVPFPIKIS